LLMSKSAPAGEPPVGGHPGIQNRPPFPPVCEPMSKFLIDHDALSGQFSTFEYDAGTDMYLLRQGQKFDAIAEANKREYNESKSRHGDGLGRKVASIPLQLFFDMYKAGQTRDQKFMKRWLNDSDNRVFRTDHSVV
jgi:hypothetical protein